jgi:ADP-heptose:LPS heptosyltransferase
MILISPWSRKTTTGGDSPKNYPYWDSVVAHLAKYGCPVIQVSCSGEKDVAGAKRMDDRPFDKIGELMKTCSTWICVDNFWHHMAWTLGEPGVVIFGSSDPLIFGHPENINLLKHRKYLRERQFGLWSQDVADPERFIGPEAVISAALLSIKHRKERGAMVK